MKKPQVGRWIHADGREETVHPHNGKDFSLEELQRFVGGHIELVRMRAGNGHATMYCNEEGKLDGLPFNAIATTLAYVMPDDFIVGDAIVISRAE